jgi:hypothetical protein
MDSKNRMVGVRLDPDVMAGLRKFAHEEDRTIAGAVHLMVKKFLREKGLLTDKPVKKAKP